jgi:hypothetical protein
MQAMPQGPPHGMQAMPHGLPQVPQNGKRLNYY